MILTGKLGRDSGGSTSHGIAGVARECDCVILFSLYPLILSYQSLIAIGLCRLLNLRIVLHCDGIHLMCIA